MTRLAFLLLIFSPLLCNAQKKEIIKDQRLPPTEFTNRGLHDLELDTSGVYYRVWIQPDLVIELGKTATLTLYLNEYNKAEHEFMIENLKKYKVELTNREEIFGYFDSVGLARWKDVKQSEDFGQITDGKWITIEFSNPEKYRIFSVYGPLTDPSNKSKKTLALINFLETNINANKIRLAYYESLAKTNKAAKDRFKSISTYQDYYKKQIDNNIFPKMWGEF